MTTVQRSKPSLTRRRPPHCRKFLGLVTMMGVMSCQPIGEPVVLPESYNGGVILEPDAGYVRLDCRQSARLPDTLALYCFDGDEETSLTIGDSTGKHNAKIVGTKTRQVLGPTCCGIALQFSETNDSSYLEIADSPDWDLEQGAISFWLRVNECPPLETRQAVISRASSDSDETGHFAIFLLPGCDWSVSLCVTGSCIDVRAHAALTPGQWSHLNVNFGPPDLELYLEGRLVAEGNTTSGLIGNRNPWVIGADSFRAVPGVATPPAHFLTGATIDMVRLSSARNKLFPLD
jgi:hypothetical protein